MCMLYIYVCVRVCYVYIDTTRKIIHEETYQ